MTAREVITKTSIDFLGAVGENGAAEIITSLAFHGFVIVPIHPTPEMIGAGWETIRRKQPMGKVFGSPGPALKEAYSAMITATAK